MESTTGFQAYLELGRRARARARLESASALLEWDQETGLPPAAASYRAEQLEAIGTWVHRLETEPEIDRLITLAEEAGLSAGDSPTAANLRRWRRQYDRAVRLPEELVGRLERASSVGLEAWKTARSIRDFDLFRPHFEELVALVREKASRWGPTAHPYDALLDEYEPGLTVDVLTTLFEGLGRELAVLVPALIESGRGASRSQLRGDFPVPAQRELNRRVARALGFDFDAGRIDDSVHPFCTRLGPRDHRVTTRFDPADFTVSFFGTIHEVGHALYEQGLPSDDFGLPTGSACSLGVHESQSRFWENRIGRSAAFWEYWFPIAAELLPDLARVGRERVVQAVQAVERSPIRVEADEATYDLHIVLRFEIERDLIAGSLACADVPERWDARWQELTGLRPADPASGCLQDVHWSCGLFGYFPTYTLGNLNAAQIELALRQDRPGLDREVASGSYEPILAWLRDRIHRHGERYEPLELMRRATGQMTSAEAHLGHLRRRRAPS